MQLAAKILGLVLVLAPVAVSASEPVGPSAGWEVREKMKALEFFIGEWEGDGWMQTEQGQRTTFQAHERAEWDIDEEVLVFHGRGVGVDPETGEEHVGHLALGAIAWDAERQAYFMWSYARGRGTGYREVEVRDKGLIWHQTTPEGQVRFTMHLDEQGRWTEKGEFTPDDGKTWYPFLGMTLTRRAGGP